MKSPARKAAAGVLAIVLLSLSGCGHSYKSDSAAALEALAGAGSVHAEMSFRMAYTLSLEGETREFEITETCSLDSSAALTSGVLSSGEGGSELRYIVELNGDEYDLYLSRGGEGWEARLGLDASELSGAGLVSDAAGPAGFYLERASGFGEAAEEEIDGAACRRYDGVLPGEALAAAPGASGAGSLFPEGAEGADAPISVWFEAESGLPRRISLDLSGALNGYVSARLAEAGLDADAITLGNAGVTVELSEFGSAAPEAPPDI